MLYRVAGCCRVLQGVAGCCGKVDRDAFLVYISVCPCLCVCMYALAIHTYYIHTIHRGDKPINGGFLGGYSIYIYKHMNVCKFIYIYIYIYMHTCQHLCTQIKKQAIYQGYMLQKNLQRQTH